MNLSLVPLTGEHLKDNDPRENHTAELGDSCLSHFWTVGSLERRAGRTGSQGIFVRLTCHDNVASWVPTVTGGALGA